MRNRFATTLMLPCLAIMLIATNCEPPKKYTVQVSENQYVLKEDGQPDRNFAETDGGVTRLHKAADGSLQFSAVNLDGQTRERWKSQLDRDELSFPVATFQISGDHHTSGKYTFKLGSLSGTAFSRDCEDFYFFRQADQVKVFPPMAPVRISFANDTLVFQQKKRLALPFWNKDTQRLEPIYLVNCPQLTEQGSSNLLVGGGINVTILVDNIIDPDAGSGSGGSNIPDLLAGLAPAIWQMKMEERANCVGYTDPKWSRPAVATIDLTKAGNALEILCNRYLHIVTPSEDLCIDISTCGAKIDLKEDSGLIELRSGCTDQPTTTCP